MKVQEDELKRKNLKVARLSSKLVAVKEIITRLDPEDDAMPIIVKVETVETNTDNKTMLDIDEVELLTPLPPVNVCAECEKKFANAQNLKRHMILHKKPTITCPMCPLKFVRGDYMKRHIRRDHKVDLPSSRQTRARQHRD